PEPQPALGDTRKVLPSKSPSGKKTRLRFMNLSACSALQTSPLTGVWYRALPLAHLQTALQTSQTRVIPGRFNSGSGVFDVLYLCENQFVAFMEVGATFGSLTTVIPNPAVAW